jgi:hypothetical protein
VRYLVSDLPAVGASAFTPLPFLNPEASSHGVVRVVGSPGTEPIPTPAPQRSWAPTLTKAGGVNSAQGSMVVPDAILPSIYVAGAENMGPDQHFGMARRRLAELPVPQQYPVYLPVIAMGSQRTGGRAVMATPRAFQTWPILGNGPTWPSGGMSLNRRFER